MHATQISLWKKTLLEGVEQVFAGDEVKQTSTEPDVDVLYNKIGRLEMERDFLKKKFNQIGLDEKLSCVEINHDLSVRQQCVLLNLSRNKVDLLSSVIKSTTLTLFP